MPRDYSATELLASIRQRTFTAGASRDFADGDVLRVLNEQTTTYLVRLVSRRRTNFLVEHSDIPVAAGTATVPVPSVAVAGAVRSLVFIVGGIPYGLIEMDLPVAVSANLTPLQTAFPTGYYFEGPNVVLFPTQTLSGTLRIHYHRRPSTIVPSSQCVQIMGFPGGAAPGYYRIAYAGSAPAAYVTGAAVDVVSNVPNFYRWQTGQLLGAGAAQALDVPGPKPANLAIGDWICLYDTAPVVTDAPAEVIEALLQSVAVKMMEAKGSDSSMGRMLKGLEKAEEDCGPLIKQRNLGAMRKISAFPDGPGWPFAGF